MRKLLALISATITCIYIAYASAYSGTCGANGDNLTWKLSCEGVLTISGNGAMKDYQLYESENPWFNYSGEINSVIIEEGVTYIGMSAFEHDSYVETIQLPNSLLSIGSRAFVWCERLKELDWQWGFPRC